MELETLLKSGIGTLVRHGANALGTILISKGLIDQTLANSLTETLVGGALVLVAIGLSIWSKKKALATPVK